MGRKLFNAKIPAIIPLNLNLTVKVIFSFSAVILYFLPVLKARPSNGFGGIPFNLELSTLKYPGSASDIWYYLYRAKFFENFSLPPDDEFWIMRIWPPGLSLWYATLSFITFKGTIFLLLHLIILSTSWFMVFIYFVWRCKNVWATFLTSFLSLIFMSTDMFSSWLIGEHSVASESLSLLFYVAFLIALLSPSSKLSSDFLRGIIPAIFLVAASLTRAVFDLMFVLTLAVLLAYIVFNYLSRREIKFLKNKIVIVFIISYLILSAPFRIFMLNEAGTPLYSGNASGTWADSWTPSDNLGAFWIETGYNGFCKSYPEKCKQLQETSGPVSNEDYRDAAISELIRDPSPWIKERIQVIATQFWKAVEFSPERRSTGLILLSATPLLLLLIKVRKVKNSFPPSTQKSSASFADIMAFFSFGPLVLAHFEPRYFYVLIVYSFVRLHIFIKEHDQPIEASNLTVKSK
jgi:hypothetical protein